MYQHLVGFRNILLGVSAGLLASALLFEAPRPALATGGVPGSCTVTNACPTSGDCPYRECGTSDSGTCFCKDPSCGCRYG
jgi:hypothetical protein